MLFVLVSATITDLCVFYYKNGKKITPPSLEAFRVACGFYYWAFVNDDGLRYHFFSIATSV